MRMKRWKIAVGIIVFFFLVFDISVVATGKIKLTDLLGDYDNSISETRDEKSPERTETDPEEKPMVSENSEVAQEEGTTEASSLEMVAEEKSVEAYVPTMDKLLKTAIEPVGNTMYIWGGGWNEADDGAGIEAVTIGVSPRWAEYAAKQDAGYNYRNTRYQIHDGLDCSGYIGWLVYNVMNTENEQEGYVMYACDMASVYASYGWGTYVTTGDFKPGDICSMSGHVWICLGTCEDGSVLLAHSSPPGVRISGTKLPGGNSSKAVELAEGIMRTYYGNWYSRYPECAVDSSYLTSCVRMRWDTSFLIDENNMQNMSGEQIAEFLYGK